MVALTHGGDIRWERNLVEDYGEIEARHGLSASVEQDDEKAYLWVERSEQPYVLAVNKATGDTDWKVEGLGTTSWASPRLVPVSRTDIIWCSVESAAWWGWIRLTGSGCGVIEGVTRAIRRPLPSRLVRDDF